MIQAFKNDPEIVLVAPKSGNYFIPDDLPKDSICIDIGSSVGGFLIKNHDRFHAVYAFEANYSNFIRGVKIVEAYGITNVVHFNLALAPTTGKFLNVYTEGKGFSNEFMVSSKSRENSHKVMTISLEDALELVNEPMIHFLKMDIEGGEHSIFNSLDMESSVFDKIQYLGIEIHSIPDVNSKDKLIEKISKRFKKLKERKRTHPEILFINKDSR